MFILFALERFGYKSVWVISGSGLHRVNKSLGQFGFDSGHIGFQVNSGHIEFQVSLVLGRLISDFGSKSVQLFSMSVRVWFRVVRFGLLLPSLIMMTSANNMKVGGATSKDCICIFETCNSYLNMYEILNIRRVMYYIHSSRSVRPCEPTIC